MVIRCHQCQREKPESAFYSRKDRPGQFLAGCRQCRGEAAAVKNAAASARLRSMIPAEVLELIGFDFEAGTFHCLKTGKPLGRVGEDGYLRIPLLSMTPRAHLVAWLLYHGTWPAEEVDHEDHVRTNNRRGNLRLAGDGKNARNMSLSRRNRSGVVGVSWNEERQKWRAQIGDRLGSGRQNILVGQFDRFEDAVEARKQAEIELGYHPNHGAAPASQQQQGAFA